MPKHTKAKRAQNRAKANKQRKAVVKKIRKRANG